MGSRRPRLVAAGYLAGAPLAPKRRPRRSKTHPRGLQDASRWDLDAEDAPTRSSRGSKTPPRGPKMPPRPPKMPPRGSRDPSGSQKTLIFPRRFYVFCLSARQRPKTPRTPKIAPTSAQEAPKRPPGSPQEAPRSPQEPRRHRLEAPSPKILLSPVAS